jgi:hypothetical protein
MKMVGSVEVPQEAFLLLLKRKKNNRVNVLSLII